MMMGIKKLIADKAGVSMIEMLVALAVFSVAMTSAMGIINLVITGQRDAIASQNVQEGIRYALEVMSKEVRTAVKNDGSCQCSGGPVANSVFNNIGNCLYFINYDNECVNYYQQGNYLMINRAGFIASATPSAIIVNDLKFIIKDKNPYEPQPRVSINIEAEYISNKPEMKQKIRVQTAISSRFYENN